MVVYYKWERVHTSIAPIVPIAPIAPIAPIDNPSRSLCTWIYTVWLLGIAFFSWVQVYVSYNSAEAQAAGRPNTTASDNAMQPFITWPSPSPPLLPPLLPPSHFSAYESNPTCQAENHLVRPWSGAIAVCAPPVLRNPITCSVHEVFSKAVCGVPRSTS